MPNKITIIHHDKKILEIFNREITEDEFGEYVSAMKQKDDREYAQYNQNVILVNELNRKIKEMYFKEFRIYRTDDFVETFNQLPTIINKLSVLEQELFRKGPPIPPTVYSDDLSYTIHDATVFPY